jgi:tRNA threonylcarbamoyladenosine biosynthesis protein TsaB
VNILALKTDGSSTYIAVFDDKTLLSELHWESNRELARDLLGKITEVCSEANLEINSLDGIICFSGPGSFTSLRIGITVANTLAYAQSIPIVSSSGEHWAQDGIKDLHDGKNGGVVIPQYGSEPHITVQKK